MLGIRACALAICLIVMTGFAAAQETPLPLPPLDESRMRLEPSQRSKRKLTRDWKVEFGGTSFSQGTDEGAAAEFHLGARLVYPFHPMFYGHFEPEAVIYSGRVQERFDKDYYTNHLSMGSSYLAFKPVKHVEVRTGSFTQDLLKNPLLVSEHRALPGFQEIISSVTLPVNARLVAQQLVPTSYSLNMDRSEKEPLPTFQTQALAVDGVHAWGKWQGVLGHYNWSNLPTKVASESCPSGNEMDPNRSDCQSLPMFRYGFDGYFGQADAVLGRAEWPMRLRLTYHRLANLRASSETRDAQWFGVGPIFAVGEVEFELRWTNFFIERNATVARYATWETTNRMGNIFRAEADFKKHGFKLKGEYGLAPTIQEDKNQQTIRTIHFSVETEYAPF